MHNFSPGLSVSRTIYCNIKTKLNIYFVYVENVIKIIYYFVFFLDFLLDVFCSILCTVFNQILTRFSSLFKI